MLSKSRSLDSSKKSKKVAELRGRFFLWIFITRVQHRFMHEHSLQRVSHSIRERGQPFAASVACAFERPGEFRLPRLCAPKISLGWVTDCGTRENKSIKTVGRASRKSHNAFTRRSRKDLCRHRRCLSHCLPLYSLSYISPWVFKVCWLAVLAGLRDW